jgi:hypothetical protein
MSYRYSQTLLLAARTRDASVRTLKKLDELRVVHAGTDRLIAQSRRYAAESHKLITEANILLEGIARSRI